MPKSLLSGGVMMLYGDVGDPWGFGDGFTPADVQSALVEHGDGDIVVRLNSGGGIATDGVAIYSLLKAHAGRVAVQIDGIAASAASLLAMAGDAIEMRDGALMMIHDAAGMTFGPAAEHQKSAAVLDKLSEQYAGIYARRSGRTPAELRAMMIEETWLSAADAVAQGLATGLIDETAAATAAFDYRLYAKAPPAVLAVARLVPATAALAARIEVSMTAEEIAAKAAADKLAADKILAEAKAKADAEAAERARLVVTPKAWAVDFYALADKSKLTLTEANTIIQASASFDDAKNAVIDALAAKQTVPNPQGGHVAFGADARDKFHEGISQAVLAQAGVEKRDPKNEFNGVRPMDIVREVAAHAGIKGLPRDPMKMVAAVITNTGGDFSNITSNIAEKSMLKGYEETDETFTQWTSVGTLPDFKQARKVDLNALPALPQVTEGQAYKYLSTGDRGEVYSVSTAGGLFSISRQAIVNDDLDVFTKVPKRLGRSAKRTIGNDVYGLLAANPIMGDGNPLFTAGHKNLISGAPSVFGAQALQTMDTAMGLQKDRSGNAVALNIVPKHFIAPRGLKFSALQLFRSTTALGQANPGVINTVQNLVESIIFEARLDAQSATAFYLAADANATDTVEVIYLNGNQTPFMEVDRPFSVDGVAYKVRIDYGVKAFAWEGLSKSAGA